MRRRVNMPRNRLRVITGAALAANLVAAVLTIVLRLARPPTGPGGPDSLYDCMIFLLVAEFAVLAFYYACMRNCGRHEDEGTRALCERNCLLWFIYIDLFVLVAYFACVVVAVRL
jgi:hypothetical protein